MLLFYVRHGEPVYSPNGLTPLGKKQAKAVCKRLAKFNINQIFCSTSQRAIDTAMPLSKKLNLPVNLLDFSNEEYIYNAVALQTEKGKKCFFDMEKYRTLFADKQVTSLVNDWHTHKDFKFLNFDKTINRVDKALDEFFILLGYYHDRQKGVFIANRQNDDNVAFFAHHGFGMSFLSSVLDIPYNYVANRFDIAHSGLTVIEFKPEENSNIVIPKMLTLSNDAHLYKEKLPTKYNGKVVFKN